MFLQPGQSRIAVIGLSPRDFAWCDVTAKGWHANAGTYQIEVGDSSRDLTQRATVRLANYFEPIPFMGTEVALPPVETAPDLAKGKRAFASSVNGDLRPGLAFDDNMGSAHETENRTLNRLGEVDEGHRSGAISSNSDSVAIPMTWILTGIVIMALIFNALWGKRLPITIKAEAEQS